MARTTSSIRPHVICSLLAALLLTPAGVRAAALPDTLRLATGSVGGTFLPVGHDLAAYWSRVLPGLVVVCDTTAGSVENLDRLISGDSDLAIVGSSPFREMLDRWELLGRDTEPLCTLGTLYIDAEQYVVRSSVVRVGNLLDLSGLVMYPGPYGSGAEVDTRRILDLIGVEPRYVYAEDRDKGYAAAAEALIRGDFDAATFSGGIPIDAVQELFARHPGEFRILPFSRHMLNKLHSLDEDFEGVVIRHGSYPGMESDVQTVGGPNLLVAGPHVSAEVLLAIDRVMEAGVLRPGDGLRRTEFHRVLQVLDPELWRERPLRGGCRDLGLAGLDGDRGELIRNDAAPR